MKIGKKKPQNKRSGEDRILGLFFPYFHSGTYFGTYLLAVGCFSHFPVGKKFLRFCLVRSA